MPTAFPTWESSATGIAMVVGAGVVTAVGVGSSDTAVATIGAKIAKAPITVTQVPASVVVSSTGEDTLRTTGRQKTQAQAIEAIQLLLDRGIDINAAANDGQTAVHGAAMQGYDDVIRFLAAKGAALDTRDKDGFTPLDVALGKAGGFGFSGKEGVVRESTAAVLREFMGVAGDATAAAR